MAGEKIEKTKNKGKEKTSDSDDLKDTVDDMKGIKDRLDKILQIASEREVRKQRENNFKY